MQSRFTGHGSPLLCLIWRVPTGASLACSPFCMLASIVSMFSGSALIHRPVWQMVCRYGAAAHLPDRLQPRLRARRQPQKHSMLAAGMSAWLLLQAALNPDQHDHGEGERARCCFKSAACWRRPREQGRRCWQPGWSCIMLQRVGRSDRNQGLTIGSSSSSSQPGHGGCARWLPRAGNQWCAETAA